MIGSSTQSINTVLHPLSNQSAVANRMASAAYWICTALTVFFFLPGGLAYAMAVPDVVDGVVLLGFPLYFIRLLGIWKILGAIAVLVPGFPRLKEWAYAGIVFDLIAAAVANATMGDVIGAEWWHVPAPLMVAVIVIASWALRPPSRRLPGPVF